MSEATPAIYAVRYVDGRSNVHTHPLPDKASAESFAANMMSEHPHWTVRVVRVP